MVPEPGTGVLLLCVGLIGLVGYVRRRKKRLAVWLTRRNSPGTY
ncbi:MAG: PEP-CTERM sorting domain-containing protein [Planctomycetota bacterium]